MGLQLMTQEMITPETSTTLVISELDNGGKTAMLEHDSLPAAVSLREMSVSALAEGCMTEMEKYRRGEPHSDQYCVELLQRALVQRDKVAWNILQDRFTETMQRWMRSHSMHELACRHDSEENYIAMAFTRFWMATVVHQSIEFRSIASALRYLRTCLNGTIFDTLRIYSRPKEVPLPEYEEIDIPCVEEQSDAGELWEAISSLLPDEKERRVAYLLYHCGLKPREILQFCPGEFSNIREIYRLSRNVTERLLRNKNMLRWRLGDGSKK